MKEHEEKPGPENPWSLIKNLQVIPKSSATITKPGDTNGGITEQ
jgi:hypothetical protein